MKRLVIKSVVLLLPFISILGFVEYRLRRVPNSYSVTKAALDRKLGEVEILVTGPSHALSGVAPQFLDRPAFNLANGSQSLHYDTQLVLKYSDSMPNLKLVIFTISYHALEYRLINSIERWRAGFYRQVYGIPGEDGKEGFELTNYSYIALYTPKEAFRQALGEFLGGSVVKAAGTETTTITDTQSEVSEDFGRKRVQLHETQMRQVDLLHNVESLERACALLKQRGVSVVFITIPTHRTYYLQINGASYQKMQETIRQITERHQVPYFNYMHDERFTDDDFINSDHLNERGARKFSQILNEDVVKRFVPS